MRINSIQSNTFQAKMNLDNIKTNKKYWENFAKSFESNTKHNGGELRLSDDFAHDFSENLLFKFKTNRIALEQGEGRIYCNQLATKEFSKITPAKAAKKIAKVFKAARLKANKVAQLRNELYKKASMPEFKQRAERNWCGFRLHHFYRPKQKMQNELNKGFDSSLEGIKVLL